MRRNLWFVAAAAALMASLGAWALTKDQPVYVRTRNTRMVSAPLSTNAVAILQPGAKLKWLGKTSAPGWHQVQAGNGVKGVVLAVNLSTTPPAMEITTTDGKAVNATSFLSSGAATKAISEGAVAYGEQKSMQSAVEDVKAMEALSKSVGIEEVVAHAQKAGLPPAIGVDAPQLANGGVE